jgi:hypothetical protein
LKDVYLPSARKMNHRGAHQTRRFRVGCWQKPQPSDQATLCMDAFRDNCRRPHLDLLATCQAPQSANLPHLHGPWGPRSSPCPANIAIASQSPPPSVAAAPGRHVVDTFDGLQIMERTGHYCMLRLLYWSNPTSTRPGQRDRLHTKHNTHQDHLSSLHPLRYLRRKRQRPRSAAKNMTRPRSDIHQALMRVSYKGSLRSGGLLSVRCSF